MPPQVRRSARWPWVALIAVALIVVVLVWSFPSGVCVDYAAGSPEESSCTSGPAIGVPGAVVITVIGALLMVVVAVRLLSPRR